ncbi:hypothetical protein, partial [Aeromonas intestinalis]
QWLGQYLTTGQNSELIANQEVTLAGEQLTLGGTVGAGHALNIQGKEVSQSGALVSGQAMVIKADNLALNGETEANSLNVDANALTIGGKVRGEEVKLTAGKLHNQGDVQAGETLSWQGSELDNSGSLQGDKHLVLKGDSLSNQGSLAGGD